MQKLQIALLATACGLSLSTGCNVDASATEADTTSGTEGDGDGDGDGEGDGDGDGDSASVSVSGDAFAFTLPGEGYGRIADAAISVLEDPSISTVSDQDGHFELTLSPGATATFVLEADGFPPARTKTFTVPDVPDMDLELVTFQVPNDELFGLLAGVLMLEVDPAACQIVSTITRVGKSLYDAGAHGEEGAIVTIDPPLPAEHGPIYFNSAVIPDPSLTESSDDGGVLFTNVPPGVYTLHAQKDGVTFEDVIMQCEAGVLVNASPPYGLQALP
jgi:hypothetical protein